MKYIIIPYIALGIVVSTLFGIEYNFKGEEMMPVYYGSPFVFAQKSLGSSMTYYYSITGLILNVLVWSVLLFLITLIVEKHLAKERFKNSYFSIIGVVLVISTLVILFESSMIDTTFEKHFTYWYWDIDQQALDWGGTYEGEFSCGKK